MNCKVYSATHVGKKRESNQDSLLINEGLNLYAVADGMGGHKGGEVASALAVEILESSIKGEIELEKFVPETALVTAFQKAGAKVYEKSRENQMELAGMGTTLVSGLFLKNKIFLANVGDSRGYLFRDPHLWRITEDHSVVNEQLKRGLISEEQALLLEDTNIITRSIGFVPDVEVDVFERELHAKDIFLFCSDGLSSMVSDEEISKILQNHPSEKLTEQLLQKALDAGGDDNVSIIVIAPEL